MSRIVGGQLGGRRLAVPSGRDVRPTSDRAREALFGTVGSMLELTGARVLDLYAGSGAVGLEAISRGARHALLVEAEPRAAAAIAANVGTFGLTGQATVARERVERLLPAGPPDGSPYELIFADPPYALPDGEINAVLAALADHGWVSPGAVVVVERPSRGGGPAWPASLRPTKQRRYGEGTLWYGRAT
ncbi:MAG: rRNA (guanine966-N2)-methyltransferase [Mycobacteriales bacterium]|jgi:16S rRNA (guanine966-N2)-methyltransferase